MNQKPLINIARRIVIEIDDKGNHRVDSQDFMLPTGTTPQTMVMLSLPSPRVTDTRMVVMSLMQSAQMLLNAIFASMQIGGPHVVSKKD